MNRIRLGAGIGAVVTPVYPWIFGTFASLSRIELAVAFPLVVIYGAALGALAAHWSARGRD